MNIANFIGPIFSAAKAIFHKNKTQIVNDVSDLAGGAVTAMIESVSNRFSIERLSYNAAVELDREEKEVLQSVANTTLDRTVDLLDVLSGVIPLEYRRPMRLVLSAESIERIKAFIDAERKRTHAEYEAKLSKK